MTSPLVDLRDRWLRATTAALRADAAVIGAALVGSLGAGRADEWSDVDLLVVVDDSHLDSVALPSAGRTFAIDARHNGPAGTRAISAQYVVDGLPLWVDWHVHPVSHASWPSDSTLLFEHRPIRRTTATFTTYLNAGEREPATPKTPAEQHAMRIALIPIAAKQIARHSPDATHTIQFLGGPPTTDRPAQLAALRQLLNSHGNPTSLAAARAYLDLLDG
ncbi:putative nucleotidyltransferase [Kribbella aluminosa]|uniref:Nucleotidyltransferase n=1 Tax=Kribbella aluminosa TaxID=416017 RepID=A0ABS4UR62_9ACTN|nr:nucleotidyltransferase domain-containing protein [Kribbella aluminosa]MBP2354123.1 putative nucleotidyltransferase [Kribbella aluminosa]